MLACGFSKIPKGLDLAISGGSGHRLATPELPPGTDIQIRTSAFSDIRRLYPRYCCKTPSTEKPRNIDSSPHPSRQERVAASVVSILLLRFNACQIVLQQNPPDSRHSSGDDMPHAGLGYAGAREPADARPYCAASL